MTKSRLQNETIAKRTHRLELLFNVLPYIISLIWILLLLVPMITSHAYITGIDYHFHMNQIYNDAMQIKTHNFNYFLSNYGFNQSGRIVNALYGPSFNYLLGFLLLICKTWTTFETTLDVISLFIGSSLMYLLCRTIHLHRFASTICGMVYITAPPILISWLGNQEFNGLGGVFTPLAFIIGIKIFQHTELHTLPIVLALTFYLQFHLATSLLCGLILGTYLLVKFISTKYKKAFGIQFAKICAWVIALNLNIFGMIYDVYSSNYLIPTFPNTDMQQAGVKLTNNGFTYLGGLFTVLTVIVIFVLLFSRWKLLGIKTTSIICLLSLFLYSSYFPWNNLAKSLPIISNVIQYPQRFAPTFWCSFLFLLTFVFDTMYYRATNNHANVFWRIVPIVPIVLIIIFWLPNVFQYTHYLPKPFYTSTMIRTNGFPIYNQKKPSITRKDFQDTNSSKPITDIDRVNTDYLPAKKSLTGNAYYKYSHFRCYHYEISTQNYWKQTGGYKSMHGNQITLHWYRRNNQTKLIKVPIILYNHSKLIVNHQVAQHFTDSDGIPIVRSKAGENTATLTYQPSSAYHTCIIIMMLAWIDLVIIGAYHEARKWM